MLPCELWSSVFAVWIVEKQRWSTELCFTPCALKTPSMWLTSGHAQVTLTSSGNGFRTGMVLLERTDMSSFHSSRMAVSRRILSWRSWTDKRKVTHRYGEFTGETFDWRWMKKSCSILCFLCTQFPHWCWIYTEICTTQTFLMHAVGLGFLVRDEQCSPTNTLIFIKMYNNVGCC